MNFDDAIKEIEDIASGQGIGLSENQLLEIGHEVIGLIVERTQGGIDADHKTFDAYSPDYAKVREGKGLSGTTVNLDLQGHMLAAMIPVVDGKDVEIGFLNEFEAKKAAWHTGGVDKVVAVKPHSRIAYVNAKTGKRVSRQEAAKDKRRKNPKTTARIEAVELHARHQFLPKRDFISIRHPEDEKKMGEVVAVKYMDNIEARRK